MKWTVCFFMLLFVQVAQSQHFQVETLLDSVNKTDVYRFPLIHDGGTAAVNINTWLHAWQLESLPGKYEKSPFEKIKPAKDKHSGVYWMDYRVCANNNRFFSVDIIGEYWSAYGEMYYDGYNFDAHNGKPILVDYLFTGRGYEAVRERILNARKDSIRIFMSKLDTSDSFQLEQYRLYKNCLSRFTYMELYYDQMNLSDSSIVFVASRCSAHVNRALDDLGRYENELLFTDIKPYLSDYGKQLFFAKENGNPAPTTKMQRLAGVYKGRLDDKIPLTLLVYWGERDGIFNAFYFYDRIGAKINLAVNQQEDGSYILRERTGNNEPRGHFKLNQIAAKAFKGTWISADGTKTYGIALK